MEVHPIDKGKGVTHLELPYKDVDLAPMFNVIEDQSIMAVHSIELRVLGIATSLEQLRHLCRRSPWGEEIDVLVRASKRGVLPCATHANRHTAEQAKRQTLVFTRSNQVNGLFNNVL